jgi:hypothetical protein
MSQSIQDNIIQIVNEGMASSKGSFTHDGDYLVNGNIYVKSLTVESTLDVGTIRATRIVTLEGSDLELGNFTGKSEAEIDGRGLRFVAPGVDTLLAYRAGGKIWSNSHIDIEAEKSFHIDNTPVLSLNSLGPTVTQSSLRQVGTLNKLHVSGDSVLGDFAHFSSDSLRLGINTEMPNSALSVIENNIELVVGSDSVHRGKIGTYTNDHLDIVTDNTVRISVANSGEVTIGHSEYKNGVLRVNGKLYVDELIADTRLTRSSSLTFEQTIDESFYGKGVAWVGKDRTRTLTIVEGPDRILSSEHIDLANDKGYFIGNQLVLSKHALGPAIVESNLVKIGVLQKLEVDGDAHFTNAKFGNTGTTLSIDREGITVNSSFVLNKGNDSELIIDSTGISIGNNQNTSRAVRIFGRVGINVSNPDSTVGLAVAGNLSFADKKFSTGTSAPVTGTYKKGDICWNTDPRTGNHVGWVCIVDGTPGQWRNFGMIT